MIQWLQDFWEKDLDLRFWLLNGPFFLFLLILSVISVSLMVEKALLFFRWRCLKKNLKEGLSNCLKERKAANLRALLAGENGPEAYLVRRCFYFVKNDIQNMHKDPSSGLERDDLEALSLLIQGVIDDQQVVMERHLGLFQLVANVSTLIGLLGTVSGMIYAFELGELDESRRLAEGISQALLTTAGGLLVAIPSLVSQQVCQNAVRIRVAHLEQLGRDLFFYFRSRH